MAKRTDDETAESLTSTYEGRVKMVEDAEDRGVKVTLDGHPAKVVGCKLKFAVVGRFDCVSSHEWSWVAVWRTLNRKDNPGAFTSN